MSPTNLLDAPRESMEIREEIRDEQDVFESRPVGEPV
jgi:hypothetical protein